MIKKLKLMFASLALMAGSLAPIAIAAPVYALDDCDGIAGCLDSGSCAADEEGCDDEVGTETLQNGIKTVINIFSLIIGVIAVIMIIVGGFKYITSNGDSGNVTSAKNTILYAIIGLVIVALAQVIVRFVLNATTGVTE
ncbi:hypothetical protein CR970_01130 [Candidatus Saccharibacteria bacterium]|nr:MAG: hypothetical protein CR970_01130 [Candidatus Saccharibacteria bacterium]